MTMNDIQTKKGPTGPIDPKLIEAVAAKAKDGRLTCAGAHKLAADLGVSPAEAGWAMDEAKVKITRCQLGLFGYKGGKTIQPPAEVEPTLKAAVSSVVVDGVISCAEIWSIASEAGTPYIRVSEACETLGLKIRPCQLGAF